MAKYFKDTTITKEKENVTKGMPSVKQEKSLNNGWDKIKK